MQPFTNVRPMTEQEYFALEGCRRVIAAEYPHYFLALDLGSKHGIYGISWYSSVVQPELFIHSETQTLWIGIDVYVAAIDMKQGNVCFAMELFGNFFEMKMTRRTVCILTDTEVLTLNSDCSLRSVTPTVHLDYGHLARLVQEGESVSVIFDAVDAEAIQIC